MPLMMRLALDQRKLSPKWSIQGGRAGMRFLLSMRVQRGRSLGLDSSVLDHLRPAIELALQVFCEVSGLARDRRHALPGELVDHVGHGDGPGDLVAQTLGDGGRGLRRREQGEIGYDLEGL